MNIWKDVNTLTDQLFYLVDLELNGQVNVIMVKLSRSVSNHNFPGQALSSNWLTSTCTHPFAKKWLLPFLNQQKGENARRKYFSWSVSTKKCCWTWRGSSLQPPDYQLNAHLTEAVNFLKFFLHKFRTPNIGDLWFPEEMLRRSIWW